MLEQQQKQGEEWLGLNFRPQNYIPGLVVGFILGRVVDLTKPAKNPVRRRNLLPGKHKEVSLVSSGGEQELKMVRFEDGTRKSGISMCSCCHGDVCGTDAEQSVSFKTVGAMRAAQDRLYMQESTRNVSRNHLREASESAGLPTFVVTDAGRTQVAAGSRTLLAIGPGTSFNVYMLEGLECEVVSDAISQSLIRGKYCIALSLALRGWGSIKMVLLS